MAEDGVIALGLPARATAIAWLNAFLATGQDKNRTLLYHKLSLELFERGVQMVGCNGAALFRTWVPEIEGDYDSEWPGVDIAPERSVVVSDEDGFGIGFMRTLLSATNDEAHQAERLVLEVEKVEDVEAPPLGEEFAKQRLVLKACGQRLELQVFEATFPDWRNLELGLDAGERVKELKISPKVFGLLGKLKGVSTVELDFHGEERAVVFTAGPITPVQGLLMPMRREEKSE